MASGGFIDNALNHIPGYGGYRDKERRRDSDRVIRDSLVLGYTQQAERLQALATQLADDRKIMLIGLVDKPLTRLHTFIDRVNTASYAAAVRLTSRFTSTSGVLPLTTAPAFATSMWCASRCLDPVNLRPAPRR